MAKRSNDPLPHLARALEASVALAGASAPEAERILLTAALDGAGATRALLLRLRGQRWHASAEAVPGEGQPVLRQFAPGESAPPAPPAALHWIAAAARGAADQPPCTVCVALRNGGGLDAVLHVDYALAPEPSAAPLLQLLADAASAAFACAALRASLAAAVRERHQVEEALARNEVYLAEAQKMSRTGAFRWQVASGAIFLSDEARVLLEVPVDYPATLAGLLRQVHPDDLAEVQEAIARASGHGPSLNFEYRYVLRSGAVKHVHLLARAVKDAAGAAEYIGALMDVSAREASQGALERAFREVQLVRNEFRLAIDHIPGLVWSALPDGYIDFLNLRWLQYTGMQADQASGWGWQSALHPDDLPGLLVVWTDLLARHAGGETEARLRRHDGTYRWFLFRAAPLFDADGTLVKWYGQTTDVDDLKRAEALLAGQKRLLEMITRGSPLEATFGAMCTIVDLVLPESEAAVALFDGRAARLRLVAAPGLAPAFAAALEQDAPSGSPWAAAVASGQAVIVEDLAVDPRWLGYAALAAGTGLRACYATPIVASNKAVLGTFTLHAPRAGPPGPQQQAVIDQFSHLAAVAIERSQMDTALRESEERFRCMAETTTDAIRITELAPLRVLYANPSFERLWGLDLAQLYQHPHSLAEAIHPDDAGTVAAACALAAGGAHGARYDIEFRLRRPGGEVRWIHERGVFVMGAGGVAFQQNSISTDITERKVGDATLKRTEAALAQARRLEAMGTLAGGIAHDFNNILGAILGYGEMALRGAGDDSRLRRDLHSIVTAGERGRSLVERILTFSRSSASERVAVDVEQVVSEAVKLLRATLPANVQLDVRLAADHAAMLGSATQVHQVVMNLATNAIQAMTGGGTVGIALETLTLASAHIATTGPLQPGRYLALRVSDSGSGVPADILDRIFDPFFTTKEVGVGTGLGLSLVHGIVLDVGGAIDVSTVLGSGSTFTAYLPHHGQAAPASTPATPPLQRGRGERIMVVDDEEALAELASRNLADLGYAPTAFTSSIAALAAFAAAPASFDAVLTDERMPGLSGSALLERLRALRPALPVLRMSGYLGEPAQIGPAEETLNKPLAAAALAAALARALGR